MINSKRIGNYGEAKTLMEFVKHQIPVSIAYGDNERYDLIAEFNGRLNKIQVKTSNKSKNMESFEVFLVNRSTLKGSTITRTYNKSDVDYYAICNIEMDIVLLYPNEGLGKTSVSFRKNIPKNNQQKDINLIEDYTFDKIINT